MKPQQPSPLAEGVVNIRGALPAVVTAMLDKPGQPIDLQAMKHLVERLVYNGVSGVVVTGTTGESSCLNSEEWHAVVRCCVDACSCRVPVIIGTGTNCTRTTIEKTKQAVALNADGALVVVPYYNKPTQEGIYEHFKAVADSVPKFPLVVYNVPGRTGTDVLPETVARIAESCRNVFAVKDASAKTERYRMLRKVCRPGFRIFSGEDSDACEAIIEGSCDGVVSVTANIVPKEIQLMCNLALHGNAGEARRVNAKIEGLHRSLFVEPNPVPVKWLLGYMGLLQHGGAVRLPLLPLSKTHHLTLLKAFAEATEEAKENAEEAKRLSGC